MAILSKISCVRKNAEERLNHPIDSQLSGNELIEVKFYISLWKKKKMKRAGNKM